MGIMVVDKTIISHGIEGVAGGERLGLTGLQGEMIETQFHWGARLKSAGETARFSGPSNPFPGFAKSSGDFHFDGTRFSLLRFRDMQVQHPVFEFGFHPALVHLVRQ